MNLKNIIEEVQRWTESTTEYRMVNKTANNGQVLNGVQLVSDNRLCPVVWIENIVTEEDTTETVIEKIKTTLNNAKVEEFDVKAITEFPIVKNRIVFRLINYDKNNSILANVPHRQWLDLALVYYIFINSSYTARIDNKIMQHWDIDEETLYHLAMENTPRLQVVKRIRLDNMIEEMGFGHMIDDIGGSPFVVMSNETNCYGASVMAYPELMKSITEGMQTDLVILPSSIHEVLLLPCPDNDLSSLLAMVKTVNETEVSDEDFLSDNVYVYDITTKEIRVVKQTDV